VAPDLGQLTGSAADDDQLLAVGPAEDLMAHPGLGERVAHRAEADRLVVAHRAQLAQSRHEGFGRDRVQTGALGRQHLDWRAASLGVGPRVDAFLKGATTGDERGEVGVVVQEVGRSRNKVGLGDAHARLRAAFCLGVVGHAGLDREPVVAPGSHHEGVAHGQAGHAVDRHRALVVGQQVGRGGAEAAQHRVDAEQGARQRLVVGRDDHSVTAPGQPGAEQTGLAAGDSRALAPVVLGPHARLGYPGTVGASVAGPVARRRLTATGDHDLKSPPSGGTPSQAAPDAPPVPAHQGDTGWLFIANRGDGASGYEPQSQLRRPGDPAGRAQAVDAFMPGRGRVGAELSPRWMEGRYSRYLRSSPRCSCPRRRIRRVLRVQDDAADEGRSEAATDGQARTIRDRGVPP
jgi:hypothetical protein